MVPLGIMRRRRYAARARRPRVTLLQRLQVLATFALLLATSVSAARYFTAQQLAYRTVTIINVQPPQQGEDI